MERVVFARALPEFRLEVEFNHGRKGEVALEDRWFGPMFEPLKNPEFFQRVPVDEFGAVCWPNGAGLAPDSLYRTIGSAKKS